MRGSPLLRSILILLLLAASAVVLVRLTAAPAPPAAAHSQASDPPAATSSSLTYSLVLSHEAREIRIDAGDKSAVALQGTLLLSSQAPVVFVKIRWKNPPVPGEHRFAKLTLEPAGKPTVTHVFDSNEDIDDFLELNG